MIDTIVLFLMLFCSGYQSAPDDYTYIDSNGVPQMYYVDSQCKEDYGNWLQTESYKAYYDDDPKNGSLDDVLTPQ